MSKPPVIRVLVADDHAMMREGLVERISEQPDMQVVAEAQDGADAVQKYLAFRPDVTVMDLQMPTLPGLAAIKAIREHDPGARIIVLTTHEGDVHATLALRAGAAGYLLKTALRRELLDTIRHVHAGRSFVEPRVAQAIALQAPADQLSERETAVLRLVAAGCPNKEIGRRLHVSEDTVKMHLKSVFTKLNVSDRTHAVTVALKRGLIEL